MDVEVGPGDDLEEGLAVEVDILELPVLLVVDIGVSESE